MFHVELRQFPHVARSFNLSRDELEARILRPLVAGRPVRWDDQNWNPEKTKVSVYEGPELAVEDMGMGRGWGNVTKHGEDVTARLLSEARQDVEAPPALEALKDTIASRAASRPIGYYELLGLAGDLAADADANQRVALVARQYWGATGGGAGTASGAGGG